MRASFLGFEIAKKALNASQKGLDVVGQNISNVNTEGYTRQRVDLCAVASERGSYFYSNSTTADVGLGVDVRGIIQVRDQVLDYKFRKENAINNTWNKSLSGLQDIENIIDEYKTAGLGAELESFYDKLQSFSHDTSSIEKAGLLRSAAQKVSQVFNRFSEHLNQIKDLKKEELGIVVSDLNELVNKISKLNTEIKGALVAGYNPNELLDIRNTYLDKLSGYTNITVEAQNDGTVAIKTGENYLLSQEQQINTIHLGSGEPVALYNSDSSEYITANGEIFAHLQLLNGKGVYAADGESQFQGVPYYQQSLDYLAGKFADVFNTLNAQDGVDKPLFSGDSGGNITAANIEVSSAWLSDAMYITSTTETPPSSGAADNICRMIQEFDAKHTISPAFTGSFLEHITSLNADIAMDVSYYQDMAETSDVVIISVNEQRESVAGVSLDEESINLIRFQKAYSAAARVMTTLDEALDIIINRMGVVGR